MSFSYNLGSNPTVDIPRMLVGDTVEFSGSPAVRVALFEDEEIATFTQVVGMQFQSGQRYSFGGGSNLPSSPVSYLRIAAQMLEAIAAVKSRMDLTGLQDAKTDFHGSAKELRALAAQYRQTDDDAGAFVIIEQVRNGFDFENRFWNQIQRQLAI